MSQAVSERPDREGQLDADIECRLDAHLVQTAEWRSDHCVCRERPDNPASPGVVDHGAGLPLNVTETVGRQGLRERLGPRRLPRVRSRLSGGGGPIRGRPIRGTHACGPRAAGCGRFGTASTPQILAGPPSGRAPLGRRGGDIGRFRQASAGSGRPYRAAHRRVGRCSRAVAGRRPAGFGRPGAPGLRAPRPKLYRWGMTRDEAILSALLGGDASTLALAAAAARSERAARYGLSHLATAGLVWSPERGRWRLTEAGRAIAVTLPESAALSTGAVRHDAPPVPSAPSNDSTGSAAALDEPSKAPAWTVPGWLWEFGAAIVGAGALLLLTAWPPREAPPPREPPEPAPPAPTSTGWPSTDWQQWVR